MSGRLASFLALPGPERWLLIEAWVALSAAWLGLRLLPFRRVRRWAATPGRRGRGPDGGGWATVEAARSAVRRAGGHHLVPMPCLVQALAGQRLLGRRGIAAELRFGVRRDGEALTAHAWLEVEGRPVGEPAVVEARLAPLVNGHPANLRES